MIRMTMRILSTTLTPDHQVLKRSQGINKITLPNPHLEVRTQVAIGRAHGKENGRVIDREKSQLGTNLPHMNHLESATHLQKLNLLLHTQNLIL